MLRRMGRLCRFCNVIGRRRTDRQRTTVVAGTPCGGGGASPAMWLRPLYSSPLGRMRIIAVAVAFGDPAVLVVDEMFNSRVLRDPPPRRHSFRLRVVRRRGT